MCVCVSWLITVANYRLQDEEKRRKGPLALESNRPAIIFGEYDDQCKEVFVMIVFVGGTCTNFLVSSSE